MTETKKLYRVVKESVYNGGRGRVEVQGVEVLYCGYDKDEARRIYHAHAPTTNNSCPGCYFTRYRAESTTIRDD